MITTSYEYSSFLPCLDTFFFLGARGDDAGSCLFFKNKVPTVRYSSSVQIPYGMEASGKPASSRKYVLTSLARRQATLVAIKRKVSVVSRSLESRTVLSILRWVAGMLIYFILNRNGGDRAFQLRASQTTRQTYSFMGMTSDIKAVG